ncbi:hypothetical protein LTR04_006388 [Oleoguttula sp. CCFEE 6159]|nr:hypothetical protein LTR04_006388 [Oleoguttula sp. CCFEE 6159]
MNETTKAKGGVIGETPVERNSYNQNFANRFCGCGEVYNAHTEKGTMFQCLGLGKPEEGGCGEDWWHPECVLGLPRNWHESLETTAQEQNAGEAQIPRKTTDTEAISGSARSEPAIELLESVTVTATSGATGTNQDAALETSVDEDVLVEDDDPPLPPGFPKEEDFEHFICYKCVNAFPWIKRYAGTPGFLPPVPYGPSLSDTTPAQPSGVAATLTPSEPSSAADFKKRKAMDDEDATAVDTPTLKRQKSESSQMPPPTSNSTVTNSPTLPACRYATLPPSPTYTLSLFLLPSFRNNLCHCALHFPLLPPHPALLDDEPTYEPPMSDSDAGGGARSVGTGSLLDRGEAALSNIDRVRAIEGVMAYNHVRDKVKAFLKPFAESGRMVEAEDIKAYFEKLRGDTVDGDAGSFGDEDTLGREQLVNQWPFEKTAYHMLQLIKCVV